MFDDAGRPQGYGQYSPFTDRPDAPGAQADPNAIPGAGAGTPSHPVDPTLNGWRSGMGGRQLGQPHLPQAPQLGGSTPLQNAIQPSLGQSQAEGGLGGAPTLSDHDKLGGLLAKYHSTDDPTYWDKVAADHGGFDATGADWLEDAIKRGDGAEGVRNGTVQKRGAKPANHTLMSAIAPGLSQNPIDPSYAQTGSSNPLLQAIRQSLTQKQARPYGV